MTLEYTDKEFRAEKDIEVRKVLVTDAHGCRYRITENKFGGLEVMALDGGIAIEPNVSNLITIKTLE